MNPQLPLCTYVLVGTKIRIYSFRSLPPLVFEVVSKIFLTRSMDRRHPRMQYELIIPVFQLDGLLNARSITLYASSVTLCEEVFLTRPIGIGIQ